MNILLQKTIVLAFNSDYEMIVMVLVLTGDQYIALIVLNVYINHIINSLVYMSSIDLLMNLYEFD